MPATTPVWTTVSPPPLGVGVGAGGVPACGLELTFLSSLNSLTGFQVKVLREDARAAFRLFETSVIKVLHFGTRGGGLEGAVCGKHSEAAELAPLAS